MNKTSHSMLYRNDIFVLSGLLILTAVTRIFLFEYNFFIYDSINYVLGAVSFSLENTRPHLPGSYLFTQLLAIINYFINDFHSSFKLIVISFSVIASGSFYLVLRKLFTLKNSFLLSMLLIFNPMVWYYGLVTEIYSFDLLASVISIYFLMDKRLRVYLIPLSLFVMGFRPTSGFLILILWVISQIFSMEKMNFKKTGCSVILGVTIFSFWFVPMIIAEGGLSDYLNLFFTDNPIPQISLLQNIYVMSSYLVYLFGPLIFILLKVVSNIKKVKSVNDSTNVLGITLLIFILFCSFFFAVLTYSKGYALIFFPPIILLFGILILNRIISSYEIVIGIILSILIFILIPMIVPSNQIFVKPELRTIGKSELIFQRLLSKYELTANNVIANSEEMNDLIELLENKPDSNFFVDIPLDGFTRAIQYYFPDSKFITMNKNESNRYYVYSGLSIDEIPKKNLPSDIFLITNMEEIQGVFTAGEIIENVNGISIVKLESVEFSEYLDYAKQLYLR